MRAEQIQERERQDRTRPHILLSDGLERHRHSAEALFAGLLFHYMDCLLSGRLEVWANAAKACADLLASVQESPKRGERP